MNRIKPQCSLCKEYSDLNMEQGGFCPCCESGLCKTCYYKAMEHYKIIWEEAKRTGGDELEDMLK